MVLPRQSKKFIKGKGKKRAVRGRPRMMRTKRSAYEVPEKASLTEVDAFETSLANQNYSNYNISLAVSSRAQDVAKGYQFYRIKRVTYVVRPLSDTFNAQALAPGGSAASVPYLYYMIDRAMQLSGGFTLAQLKQMGAKARRLDDKTLTFSLTPSVLNEVYDNTPGARANVQYAMCPWLPTRDNTNIGVWNPNTTDHQGVVWRVEQISGDPIGYAVERRIQFEFKKPSVVAIVPGASDIPLDHDAPVKSTA